MAKRAYVLLPTQWLNDREVMQMSDGDFGDFVRAYTHDPDNIRYEDAHHGWREVRQKVAPLVFERDGYQCKQCGSTENLQIDHIHPVSRGGTNDVENLQTLCRTCNIRKGNKVQ